MNSTMNAREWLLLVLLSILWGGSFFFVELGLTGFPPATLVLGRTGLAAAALILAVRLGGLRMPTAPRPWGAFLVMGMLNGAIPYSLIVWAQVHIDSGPASVLNATTPFFSIVLAHFLTSEERITGNRIAGLTVGLCGVVVLTGRDALHGLGFVSFGHLAVLAAALSYACAGIFGRRFRGLPPAVAAAGQVTGSALLMLPVALYVDRPWTLSPGMDAWAALVGIALLSTALAYLIYFRILATAGATNVLLVTLLIPVSALALGVLALGERPGWNMMIGTALILLGIAAIDGRLWRRVLRVNWRNRSNTEGTRTGPRGTGRTA